VQESPPRQAVLFQVLDQVVVFAAWFFVVHELILFKFALLLLLNTSFVISVPNL
jgi:hypothetical protein